MSYRKFIKNCGKQFAGVGRKVTATTVIVAGCLLANPHTIVEGKSFKNFFTSGQESGNAYFSECEGSSIYNLARTSDERSIKGNVSPIVSFSYPANNPSEDRFNIANDDSNSWRAAAVFDGHGGWQISEYASKYLLNSALSKLDAVSATNSISVDEIINNSFQSIEDEIIKSIRSSFKMGFKEVAKVGSCVLLAFQKADRLVIANCGDCRAVLGTQIRASSSAKGTVAFSSTRLTRDHNAREPAELLLLQQNHPNEPNIVVCKNPHACYVKGRLQLTRSLGDAYLKHAEFNGSPDMHRSVGGRYIPDPYTPPYVSYLPDIHHLRLDSTDRFVILATDGLWDYLPEQEAVDIVASCLPNGRQKEAAEMLVLRALELAAEESGMSIQDLQALPQGRHRRSRHDDTTAVVIYF